MTDDLVLRHDDGGLCTLTLNRPAKLNALTPSSFVALRAHLDAIAADRSVGCVVVQGAGRSFCAGHDLGSIATGERAPSRHFESETVDALEALPQPTIARLHGHCFTGGLELHSLAGEREPQGDRFHVADGRRRRAAPVPWNYGTFVGRAVVTSTGGIPSPARTPASWVRFETSSLR